MAKKIPAVKIEVASLSNTQPPKPAKPPPQLAGAKRTKAAEKIIKGIANFFQELNTCSFKNPNITNEGIKETESMNNGVPKELKILLIYIYIYIYISIE